MDDGIHKIAPCKRCGKPTHTLVYKSTDTFRCDECHKWFMSDPRNQWPEEARPSGDAEREGGG